MFKIFLSLLLFIGLAWGQEDFDRLVSKDDKEYLGEYSKTENGLVHFQPLDAVVFQSIPVNLIKTLQLKDGIKLINNGKINNFNYRLDKRKKLSFKERAIFDARNDANKWVLYPPIALLTFGAMMLGSQEEPWESFPATLGVSTASLTIPYLLFKELTWKNIENFDAKDKELYKKFYFKEFRKRKLTNIIFSSLLTGVLGPLLYFSAVESGLS